MRLKTTVLAFLTTAACAPETIPTSPVAQLPDLRLAKAAPSVPRALIVFADIVNVAASGEAEDWQPAGITGDGRLRNGANASGAPSNEYLGGQCGVNAIIENGARQSGDLDYDPDLLYSAGTSCGAARFYNFYLAGTGAAATRISPHSRITGIWALGAGQTVNKGQGFGVRLDSCQLLMFDARYGGDDLKVSRLDSGTGPRQWSVSSQGAHTAACVVQNNKGPVTYTATGVKYYLPFAITVTEVP